MRSIFSIKFLKDTVERVIATFAQAYVAATVVLPGDLIDKESLKVALGAAILAVFKAFAAKYKGDSDTASFV